MAKAGLTAVRLTPIASIWWRNRKFLCMKDLRTRALTPSWQRIRSTGAPVPEGADRIVIQEDATRSGDLIRLSRDLDPGPYVRPAGMDFKAGARVEAPRILGARDLALIAAMNAAAVTVARRPEAALIATGDELVMPGEDPLVSVEALVG